jgi:nicotinate-nucleotide adenylyltransferase
MYIGLFGGTFNPIHNGHLWAALKVKDGFNLDQIYLIPAAVPPHKTPGMVADADDRLQMINSAIADLSGISVADVELRRPGPSYTIDTVRHFKKGLQPDSRIFLMMGLDAFLEIDSWKSYRELLEQIAVIVIARPAETCPDAQQGRKILEDYLKTTLSENNYKLSAAGDCYTAKGKQPIYFSDVKALDISSTLIRKKVKAKQTIENWVPPQVAEYIQLKGLYA